MAPIRGRWEHSDTETDRFIAGHAARDGSLPAVGTSGPERGSNSAETIRRPANENGEGIMLRVTSSIEGYKLSASDGELGKVKDFLVDDRVWSVRYLVADTGPWLLGRRVLLSSAVLQDPDWTLGVVPVALTKEQIENAPVLADDKPVSMQHEIALHDYYGWPRYWGMHTPVFPAEAMAESPAARSDNEDGDPHLRSTKEVEGYHIDAADGEIGHVDDFVVDTEGWWLRYAVIKTRNWLPGRKVLVAPDWFESVHWVDRKVKCSLTREEIKNSPEFDPSAPVNREYEEKLHDYYGRPKYWISV